MNKNLFSKFCYFVFFVFVFISSFGQKYHRIKSTISQEKLNLLLKKGLEVDHFHFENGEFTAELSDADLIIFNKANIKFQFLIEDLEKNNPAFNNEINKKNGKGLKTAATPVNFNLGSYAGFFTFQEMENILNDMRAKFPNLISAKSSIGTTVEGRFVFMVKISDNPDIDEAEPELFLNAVHHAREPISMSQLIYYMWHLLENYATDPEVKTLVNSTELFIVPCVNPDGYIFNQVTTPNGGGMWRKNRKNNGNGTIGVDLNRNYGFKWGFDNTGSSSTTSSDAYRGPSAFSEPETQIVRNFCNTHNFVASMDFHSSGNFCIYPYGYQTTNINPELSLFQQMGAYLTAENGFKYGNAPQTVTYTANGTGDDWKYGEQTTKNKIYSFTPEIGASTDGFYPAQTRIIPLCESTLQMNRKILRLASKYAELTPSASAIVSSLTGSINFNLQNFSLRNPSYIVSIMSNSPFVSTLSANQTISNMTLFQNTGGLFTYSLLPSTPVNSQITFNLQLDNGHDIVSKTITVTYNCPVPTALQSTSIGLNSASLSWTAVSGATGYLVSFKPESATVWSNDSSVTNTSLSLVGLNENTLYNYRVKTNSCVTYANGSFRTLAPCLPPASLTVGSVSSNTAALSWPAVSGIISYQVEYKLATATSWIIASSAVTSPSFQLSGLIANQAYNCRVRSNCSSLNSTYSISQFSTLQQVYCASKGTNLSLMWIDLFKLSNINRTSGADAGYYNGTQSVVNLTKGVSNTLSYSPGFSGSIYRVYWKVWIDYNKNGVFTDTGEQILSSSTTGSGTYTVNFTVPTSALTGQTRIRVSMKYSAYSTPCETFTYGEVEDYTVNISSTVATTQQVAQARIGEVVEKSLNFSEISATAFPNPAQDEIMIEFKNTDTKGLKLYVLDIKGNEMFSETMEENQTSYGINVAKFTPALYLIKLEKAEKQKTIKFVKK